MSTAKRLDCMAMKDRVQAELLKEHAGKTDEQIRAERQRALETGEDPVARWWRTVMAAHASPARK
jgi:hypothetical protein